MKTTFEIPKSDRNGSALMLTLIMSAIALAILASVMAWSSSNTRLTHRSIQYTRSIAAAEAATEKVVGLITRDYLYGGESWVINNLNTYRTDLPTVSDSAYWNTWQFNDGNGNLGQTYVQFMGSNYMVVAGSAYAGLKASVSTYAIASHARDAASSQYVVGGVLQTLQLYRIPIFQFAMYSSGDMEISCGKPFTVTGRVHSNNNLYVEPDNPLTFESSVTAVTDILNLQRHPLDTRGAPSGSVVYVDTNSPSIVQPLTLPMGGITNTPEAIREIIEVPPTGEDPNSALGLLRYYNKCDLVLSVSDTSITAASGHFNPIQITPFGGLIDPTNELSFFVSVDTTSFWDGRESKTVQPIDINIGNLTSWIATNGHMPNLSSIYIVDNRTPLTLPTANLGAVRVFNGTNLPLNGLTVATGRPLYVWGDYNDTANLGTTNTTATHPASLVADAITILSDAWQDSNQKVASKNNAADTTVNAALLTGVVETTLGQYSGGMENFPRFLESWGPIILTYNGSMVRMFPSLYATNVWEGINYKNDYYDPPTRNWNYDTSFDDPTKLPPKTPGLLTVSRSQWSSLAPDTNVAKTYP